MKDFPAFKQLWSSMLALRTLKANEDQLKASTEEEAKKKMLRDAAEAAKQAGISVRKPGPLTPGQCKQQLGKVLAAEEKAKEMERKRLRDDADKASGGAAPAGAKVRRLSLVNTEVDLT